MSLILKPLPDNLQGFIKNARRSGFIMMIIGLVGILLPNVISLTLNAFIDSIFLFSALALAYVARQSQTQNQQRFWPYRFTN